MSTKAYVVAALSNEAPYVLEWLAHYRGLGFDGAILFTHDCKDGTDAMVARLAEMGHTHHVPLSVKPGQDPQRKATRQLPAVAEQIGALWCMPVSVSEFLDIRVGNGVLEDLIQACGDQVDAISVCRRAFGASGQRGLPPGPVRETYRMAAAENDLGAMMARGIKTLFRPDRVARVAPHRPFFDKVTPPVNWRDGGGKPMDPSYLTEHWTAKDGFAHDLARLNFYASPSPEAVVLRDGVPGDKAARKAILGNWSKLNVNTVADQSMSGAMALSDPFLQGFHADPTLADLQDRGRAWHIARIQELLGEKDVAALCEKMAGHGEKVAPVPTRSSPRGGGGKYAPPPVRPIRFDVKPSDNGATRTVLHGGFHKTATTYMQRLLEDNETWLGRQSVLMVQHLKLRKHITFPSQLDAYRRLKIRRRTRYTEEELKGFTDAFFKEPLSLKPERMILSDENVPGLPSHCVTSGKLYKYRKMFFQCFAERIPVPISDAYFAVRNYADFFASSYVEYLRSATTTTTGKLITPEEMKRNVFSSMPNWAGVFADFQDVFPNTRLHVWRFEDFRAMTPRVLSEICGETVNVKNLKPPKERNARPSASAAAVEELVLISEMEGAAVMAEKAKDVQDMYPQGDDYERFDPWTASERAHLTAIYDRDWQALCADGRITTLTL